MNKFALAAVVATLASVAVIPVTARAAEVSEAGAAASTQAVATVGKMVFGAKGEKIGAVYKVAADGSAQIILNGKMVTVPAATLSLSDGKIVTTLTKAQLARGR